MHEILAQYDSKWPEVIDRFQKEINTLRTNRAHATMVENIMVEAYNTTTPLNQLANINTPEPRQLLIEPWDKSIAKDIEQALMQNQSSLSVVNDGESLRVSLPPMTEETRQQTVTQLHKKMEEARIAIRHIREDVMKELKTQKSNNELGEDDFFKAQKDIQAVVDEYNAKIKELGDVKEKDIMTI